MLYTKHCSFVESDWTISRVQVHEPQWIVAQCLPEFVRLSAEALSMSQLEKIVKKFQFLDGAQHTIVLQVHVKGQLHEDLLSSLGMNLKYRFFSNVLFIYLFYCGQVWVRTIKSLSS
jgi:hypothetical protein